MTFRNTRGYRPRRCPMCGKRLKRFPVDLKVSEARRPRARVRVDQKNRKRVAYFAREKEAY